MTDHSVHEVEPLVVEVDDRGDSSVRSRRNPASPANHETTNVRVVCRLRPMNEREKKAGTVPAATASTDRKEVAVVRPLAGRQMRSTFHFDDVLASFSTQEEVFAATLEPLVTQVLAGFEATAFAYGQTGTGKTYTMEGDVGSEEGRGLVPRAAAAVIERLKAGEYTDHTMTVSYLEIYNEELSDLLAPPQYQPKLDLKDVGGGRGVCCIGLSEVPVSSLEEILELIGRAQERRRIAETRLNTRSSRSHCIFTMKVRCRRRVSVGELENVGKLHLVDLAGSECAKKASFSQEEKAAPGGAKKGHDGSLAEEERERRSINQSLLTLGRVISALRDNSGRVPYRDSKLTRLLQDALGGKCKTVVIATLSPAMNAVEETISTLSYAEQASGIKNRPVASSLLRTNRPAASEVRFDAHRPSSGQGATEWAELEMKIAYLTQEVEEAQAALARKYQETQGLTDRAEAAEGNLKNTQADLNDALVSVKESRFELDQLETFSDDLTKVATSYVSAFDAASAHGLQLDNLLCTRAETSAAVRSQVRAVCSKAEMEASAAATSCKAAAQCAAGLVVETHDAHKDAYGTAIEATEAQHLALDGLAAGAHKRSEQWENSLQTAGTVAHERMEKELSASEVALAKIEVASTAVSEMAAKCCSGVNAAAEQGNRALEQQVEAFKVDLGSDQETISTMANALIEELGYSRDTAKNAGEAALIRFKIVVQDLLVSLRSRSEANLSTAETHFSTVTSLKDRSLEDAQRSAALRNDLSAAISAAASEHACTIGSKPPLLESVLQTLEACLENRGRSTKASLTSGSGHLNSAMALLDQVAEKGKADVELGLSQASVQLNESWDEQRHKFNKLLAVLEKAATEQRESNAADAMQKAAAKSAAALKEELAASVASLGQARDEISREVNALQEQRASEQKIVSSLVEQRDALHMEVTAVRQQLEGAKVTLETTKAEIAELGMKHEQGRARAIEKIMSLVSSEFGVLGRELEETNTSVRTHLDEVAAIASSVDETLVAAHEHCISVGQKVAEEAGAWSRDVDARCCTIVDSQQCSSQAAHRVDQAGSAAASGFKNLEALSSKWGASCEEVATMIDSVTEGVGELCSMEENLRPKWAEARDSCGEVAKAWVAGCGEVGRGLEGVGADVTSAAEEFGALSAEGAKHLGSANEHVASWLSDSRTHETSLDDLSKLAARSAKEEDATEKQRGSDVDVLVDEASDISKRLTKAQADAGNVVESAGNFAEAMPADVEVHINALEKTASEVTNISSKTKASFHSSGSAIDDVCKTHLEGVRTICEGARQSTQDIIGQSEICTSEAIAHRATASMSASQARAHWAQFDVDARATSAALREEADAAAKAAAASKAAFTTRMVESLERGNTVSGRAVDAFTEAASAAAASLSSQEAAMRAGLSAEPLRAFDEAKAVEMEVVPSWPSEALKPKGMEVTQRPSHDQLMTAFRKSQAEVPDDENSGILAVLPGDKEKDSGTAEREVLKQLNA